MTLPRNKSRAITVDGTRYRWMASAVDREFAMFVRVEHAAGQGQCLLLRRRDVYGTSRVPPVTPCYVAAAVRHALALGWEPSAPGPDFSLDAAQLDRPRRPLPSDEPPAGNTALWSRVDFDPLRVWFPWKHHDPGLFVEFRLSANPSDKQLGSLFAHLARTRNLAPDSRPAHILEALSRPGVETESGREPWNGHDPFSTAVLEVDSVRMLDPDRPQDPPASVPRAQFEQMLDGLEHALRGFLKAAERWLSVRVSPEVTAALIDQLATSMAIEKGP